MSTADRQYWDRVSVEYQGQTRILTTDFHYGPLVPGDSELGLLPAELAGMRCLEAGCGAAQNSLFLASRGAACFALDLSKGQLAHGRKLARARGTRVEFLQGDLDALPLGERASFDLVHSSYALPFVERPGEVIAGLARVLRPGGRLLLSTAHPLFSWEWLEVDGETGVFVTDYFFPPADTRSTEDGGRTTCRAVSLSRLFSWLRAAGLEIEAFLEPGALPVERLTEEQVALTVPYLSDAWLEGIGELERIPVVAIFAARKSTS